MRSKLAKHWPWLLALAVPPLIAALGFGQAVGQAVSAQQGQGLVAEKVFQDPMKLGPEDGLWDRIPARTITLMAQPMALPKPKLTLTEQVEVKVVHNRRDIAFLLSWKDPDQSQAGRLGEFSDALALEFPFSQGQPPSPFMGEAGKPVHIFHWRAQYQRDQALGRQLSMADLYPNLSIDAYPMEYKDVQAPRGSEAQRRQFSPGRATGNPQSYPKAGVDEVLAEGFGTSSVTAGHGARGVGSWRDGVWKLVISRPLRTELGSRLIVKGQNYVCFAIWQGGKREVGSRKSVSLMWVELDLKP